MQFEFLKGLNQEATMEAKVKDSKVSDLFLYGCRTNTGRNKEARLLLDTRWAEDHGAVMKQLGWLKLSRNN